MYGIQKLICNRNEVILNDRSFVKLIKAAIIQRPPRNLKTIRAVLIT